MSFPYVYHTSECFAIVVGGEHSGVEVKPFQFHERVHAMIELSPLVLLHVVPSEQSDRITN